MEPVSTRNDFSRHAQSSHWGKTLQYRLLQCFPIFACPSRRVSDSVWFEHVQFRSVKASLLDFGAGPAFGVLEPHQTPTPSHVPLRVRSEQWSTQHRTIFASIRAIIVSAKNRSGVGAESLSLFCPASALFRTHFPFLTDRKSSP